MWLYLPPECCPSLVATEGSTSDSSSPAEPALFVTSSGKPSPRPSSWPGWKTRPWRALLSGTTLEPSTVSRGVASWIASLAEVPVRTSPSQESAKGSGGSEAGSGNRCSGLLAKQGLLLFSGRTSEEQSTPRSTWCRKTLKASATELRDALSQLQMSELRTNESGSSSWPTSTGTPYGNNQSPSPGAAVRPSLDSLAAKWATPAARDSKGANSKEHLAKARGHHDQLANQVAMQQWRTPTAKDGSGTGGESPDRRLAGGHSVALKDQASSLPHPEAPTGSESRPQLNPRFVEWLMGLPFAWTLPVAMTGSDSSETASSSNRPPSTSLSAGNDSSEAAE